LAALRRLLVLIVGACLVTAAVSVVIGAILGAHIERSLTLGFYLSGCFLILAGFFVGNRGPTRVKGDADAVGGLFAYFGMRRVRWATLGEQNETINNSAVFVVLGFILIAVGFAFDAKHTLI
jgi:urea transporter